MELITKYFKYSLSKVKNYSTFRHLLEIGAKGVTTLIHVAWHLLKNKLIIEKAKFIRVTSITSKSSKFT